MIIEDNWGHVKFKWKYKTGIKNKNIVKQKFDVSNFFNFISF